MIERPYSIVYFLIVLLHLASTVPIEHTENARKATTTNLKGIGPSWSLNTLCSDATQTFLNNQESDVLQLRDFGFSLPTDAQYVSK